MEPLGEFNVTIVIVIITALVSFQAFNNPELRSKLIFNAYVVKTRREWYRLFSHGLIHADWMHALFNLWALWMFGRNVEIGFLYYFGDKSTFYYILLYVLAIGAASTMSYFKHQDNPGYNALGASGAVSAVVFASILMHPWGSIQIFPFPFDIPAWIFGILYLWYSHYMSKKGMDNIGHDAHFWGAVFGFGFTAVLQPDILENFVKQIVGY